MVAFEDMPASGAERNALLLRTPPTLSSGWYKGVLIQDREDRRKAREKRLAPRRLPLTSLLREETLAAIEWARRVGFTDEEIPFAAPAAVLLRRVHGAGVVRASMVREHCEQKYPHVFSTRERAA